MKRWSSSARMSLLAAILGCAALAGSGVAADVLASLEVTEARARDAMFDTLAGGGLHFPGKSQVFTSAPAEVRVAMVNAVAALGKAYVQSADFRKRYEEYRVANRPQPPAEAPSFDAQMAESRKAREESQAAMEEMLKSLPPETREETRRAMEAANAQMAQLEQDPEFRKQMEEANREIQAANATSHATAVKEFEERYPGDANVLVARRLQEFLDLTADIDFDAQLTKSGSHMRFADQKLEGMPGEWKYCFRAGKPAVEAARTFAQAWLTELGAAR